MLYLPEYIDNHEERKLEHILKLLIEQESKPDLDIATSSFDIGAWAKMKEAFNKLSTLRLLIGQPLNITLPVKHQLDLKELSLGEEVKEDFQSEIESMHYDKESHALIKNLIDFLKRSKINVVLYGGNERRKKIFLHGNAYLFSNCGIVGSSDFTTSGLDDRTELNVLIGNSLTNDIRNNWFNKLWEDERNNHQYKQTLIQTLDDSMFGSKPYTPYEVFMKALYELFKEETKIEISDRTSLRLASFQHEAVERAIRLLERHNGCIIADAVGLGKTFIGLRLIEHYLYQHRKSDYVARALVICPAQLRDLVWLKKLDEFGIKASVLSQEELGRKEFDFRKYNDYDIVLVDESHNFRNPGTNRYANLQELLSTGKHDKCVVLLTATPINNSIFDLYHQTLLLTRNREDYYREWSIPNLKEYFQQLNNREVDITELLFHTMVRRSRQDVIRRQQAGEKIVITGKEIRFPQRRLEQFTYNFEASFQGFYAGIAAQIDNLNFAPYNIKAFKKKSSKKEEEQAKRNQASIHLMKTCYLKRLESSIVAFEKSIFNQKAFQEEFNKYLEENRLLDSKSFKKILAAETDDEENIQVDELISSLATADPEYFKVEEIKDQISKDLQTLKDILEKLRTIRIASDTGKDSDLKLAAFKTQLLKLKGQKVLVFSYFKDTAEYIFQELQNDCNWLQDMQVDGRTISIDIITGGTPSEFRGGKVKRFAPQANCQNAEEIKLYETQQIDILICTDVLSEGQNLQDAGVLINYDLHWNPVRMIQRAGRIDRLGTKFLDLYIYNCFPEQGLEVLLGLVDKLQKKIAAIDISVGLDASVLGEVISQRSLEELRRLKDAKDDVDKEAILAELEKAIDLVSLEEMRFPLLEFMQQVGEEQAKNIPLGIHSVREHTSKQGLFLALRTRDCYARYHHDWHFYHRIGKDISTDNPITDKAQIFKLLQCKSSDFSKPLPPRQLDKEIFSVLNEAIEKILTESQEQTTGEEISPAMSKAILDIYDILKRRVSQNKPTSEAKELDNPDLAAVDQQLTIINANVKVLNSCDKKLKSILKRYKSTEDFQNLFRDLDQLFKDRKLTHEPEADEERSTEMIKKKDIQLICYQWFK